MSKNFSLLLGLASTALVLAALFVAVTVLDTRMEGDRLEVIARLRTLEERLGRIEQTTRDVRQEVARRPLESMRELASSPVSAPREAESPDVEGWMRNVEEKLDEFASIPATRTDDPAVPRRDRIREVVEEVREAERVQEEEERNERERALVAARVEGLRESLALSDVQVDDMTRILVDESVKRRTLFADARQGGFGGFTQAGMSGFEQIRKETSDALSEVLQPWQLEKYQEAERGPGRRRGGDRGGDRGRESRQGS
jgi:hypothetical protein